MIFDIDLGVGVWPFRKLRFTGDPDALAAWMRTELDGRTGT